MTSPETPNAPAHEPHPQRESDPPDVDPATVVRVRKMPDEHNGEHIIEVNPPGDCPS